MPDHEGVLYGGDVPADWQTRSPTKSENRYGEWAYINDPDDQFRSVVSDQLKLSALIVFYALRSLPLMGELLLIPSLAFMGCSMAIVESDDKFQRLKKPFRC